MMYNVQILLRVDPSFNQIPADENAEYLTELLTDLLYDFEEIEVIAISITDERN